MLHALFSWKKTSFVFSKMYMSAQKVKMSVENTKAKMLALSGC